jgi:hypothetical protein
MSPRYATPRAPFTTPSTWERFLQERVLVDHSEDDGGDPLRVGRRRTAWNAWAWSSPSAFASGSCGSTWANAWSPGCIATTTRVSLDAATGRCSPTTTEALVADSPAPSTAAPAPKTSSRRCARDAPSAWNDGTEIILSPCDLRYGLRDAATAVRISATLADAEAMDALPLLQPATRSLLAACFAQHVPADQAVNVTFHSTLVVDARGKTRKATLTAEPSDAAAPPSKTLLRCLERALFRVPFDCSPSGQETQTHVTYCMRRDRRSARHGITRVRRRAGDRRPASRPRVCRRAAPARR